MVYKLSATLKAHTSDVRAVAAPTNQLVLSASRDTTAIAWQKSQADNTFTPESVFRASSRYVNSVAYIPPTPDAPKGYAVTGGQDTVINVYRLHEPRDEPDFTLLGHQDNVCTLHVSAAGTIISGSWDRTAKVWKNFKLVHDLKGHEQSVWAVLAVDEEQVLTGSADRSIRLWHDHKLIHTYTGHADAVRGLSLVPDIGFASCSNDSEIRVWTLGGDLVYSLSGHTSFVYSLSVLPNGDIVSGGEDRTVRVWKDGECSQAIVQPAISVWAVATMPNGDIVSGCSDGVVRVFSESEERWALASDLKEYEDLLAQQALPAHQVGDVKKSDLPGLEALSVPGKKSGEVKMVKNNDAVEAHQWDGPSSTWQKIGDVVDAVGQGRKQLFNGREYDYVFDVDIQDGVPPLKLPYNITENPYSAAQRFLQSNELPLTYIDEVVRFIEKNTAGVNLGTTSSEYVDPYTGASRYQSSAASVPTAGNAVYQDPFTGASRYVAQSQAPSAPSSAVYQDPFTGASRYSGTPTPTPTAVSKANAVLPVLKCVHFRQVNLTAMQSKLLQLDGSLRNETGTSTLALNPGELQVVNEIFAFLSDATTSTSRSQSLLSAKHLEVIIHILERWPLASRFPLIDLSRLIAAFSPDTLRQSSDLRNQFFSALFRACEWTDAWASPLSKAQETNILLLFRTLANIFSEEARIDSDWVKQILDALAQIPYDVLGKTQRVALVTLLFNISCVASFDTSMKEDMRVNHLVNILRILESETADTEVIYRALVALGNIVAGYKKRGATLEQSGEVVHRLQSLSGSGEERIKNVVEEIRGLL